MSHATTADRVVTGTGRGHRSPPLFQSLALTHPEHRAGRNTATLLTSALLHTALVVGVVIVPIVLYDAIPSPGALHAFFVPPLEVAPPPPPPPPPAPAARPAVTRAPQADLPPPTGFVAPIEVPAEIQPEEGLDLGVEGGVAGGVEGGVPGGVVGGVVGGLPQEAPPPPQAAVRVGGQIKAPVKIRNVDPVYPDLAKQARVQGVVILECTISPSGKVTDVRILRGIPLLDPAALEAVRQWTYTPTLLNGIPVPVIMTVTVTFDLT